MKRTTIKIVAIIAALVIGGVIGATGMQTKPITVTKEADLTNWKQLKNIDDQSFTDATKALSVIPQLTSDCSGMVIAATNGDTYGLTSGTADVHSLGNQESDAATALEADKSNRQAILNKLGY